MGWRGLGSGEGRGPRWGRAGPSVLFIADSITFASSAHPVLAVDLEDKILSLAEFPEIAGRTPFRCIPSALAPALRALDKGQELPPPFGDREQVWQMLFSDLRVPRTTVVSIDGRIPNLLRSAMAVPALFAAVGPDPLDAALQALYAAAVTFGRDHYPALFEEVRRGCTL